MVGQSPGWIKDARPGKAARHGTCPREPAGTLGAIGVAAVRAPACARRAPGERPHLVEAEAGGYTRMATGIRGGLAAGVIGLMTAGCASTAQEPGADGHSPPPTTVEVSNHNWADVTIYAVRSGLRVRLGTVRSMHTSTFRLPDAMLSVAGLVRLVAAPIGSTRTHSTDGIVVNQGERIQWRLENALSQSNYSVHPR
jgi:hypothetical protein